MKVIIVGGMTGGAAAAARIRRLDESAQIILLDRSALISYSHCGLPHLLDGGIADPHTLAIQTAPSFWHYSRIEARPLHEVTAIDTEAQTVTVHCLEDGSTYLESYDKLVLAPGARANWDESAGERVFTLRSLEDTFRIVRTVQEKHPKTAIVAGCGFVGLQLAQNLLDLGLQVTLIQRGQQVLPALDYDMAVQLHSELRKSGAVFRLGIHVTEVKENGEAALVTLDNGFTVRADMAFLAMGTTPDTQLAQAAGLALGERGGIAVNERMETSAPHVYAVGDAAEVTCSVTGRQVVISSAGAAAKQGRVAADVICGLDSAYSGTQNTQVLRSFGLTTAVTGLTEQTAQAEGLAYEKIVLSSPAAPACYPDGGSMTLKVLYEKESLRLLGAQIVGHEGVEKRIDVLATAIRAGMKAPQLQELDLSYAPPCTTARDLINDAGHLAENLAAGLVKQFHWIELESLPRDDSVSLLDVRTPEEHFDGRANSFRNIPLDELRDRMEELEPGKPVYVMCQNGLHSYAACRLLTQAGYDCAYFSGGYHFYENILIDSIATQHVSCG